MRASSVGGRAAGNAAQEWARKKAEQLERAKAIREERKAQAAVRQAERDSKDAAKMAAQQAREGREAEQL